MLQLCFNRLITLNILMAFLLGVLCQSVIANPQGAEVQAGDVTFSESDLHLDVNQASEKAIIDWQSFDIDVNEHTQFHQPSSTATTLNRVKSNDPSQILGKLSANGNLILINPNGVFFGKDSRVDVNAIIATTADISNENFLADNLEFNQPGNPDAQIINHGLITAKEAGLVGLVAPQVLNHGIIRARLGKVQLASGDVFTLDLYGDGLFSIKISDAVKKQLIANSGEISAEAGFVSLTAAAAKHVVDSLIQIEGEIKTPSVAQQDGKILITGEQANVHVKANSIIDASGEEKAGTIHIGGEYLGQGDTPTAANVIVDPNTKISASAKQNGDGGEVIVWSDNTTQFYGEISAHGGAHSGDGGFIETSGKQILIALGLADASAPNGQGGQWLLDPRNITIRDAGPNEDITESPTGTFTLMCYGG